MVDRVPRYYHLPLVVGTDGRRLAKRHGDTRLSFYRSRGVPAGRVLALLARWCGMPDVPASVAARDLISGFDLTAMPRAPIIFGPADDEWLRATA